MVLRKEIFNFRPCIFTISIPFKDDLALHFYNLDSPLPTLECSVLILLKLAQRFWRRRFLKKFSVISLFHNYVPLEKFWTSLNPLYPRTLCAKFVEIGPVVLEEKMKIWKVYRQTDKQTETDDSWTEKPTWAFSSGKLKHDKGTNGYLILRDKYYTLTCPNGSYMYLHINKR